jgi:hypothetical protein
MWTANQDKPHELALVRHGREKFTADETSDFFR